MRHFASLNDLGRDKIDTVCWNREADTVSWSIKFRVNSRQRWDSYQVTLHVYQSPTTIAGIDGGVGLNGIGNNRSVLLIHAAAKGADNTICHRLGDTQRITNCHNILPNLQF